MECPLVCQKTHILGITSMFAMQFASYADGFPLGFHGVSCHLLELEEILNNKILIRSFHTCAKGNPDASS